MQIYLVSVDANYNNRYVDSIYTNFEEANKRALSFHKDSYPDVDVYTLIGTQFVTGSERITKEKSK